MHLNKTHDPPPEMTGPCHQRTPHSLHVFSMKPPSSSTLSSMKIKTLIHTFILSHVYRIIRALSRAKSILIEILKEHHFICPPKKNKYMKKFLGSFRLHYNWCSSHVLPVPAPVLEGFSATHLYYDSAWSSFIPADKDVGESQLSGYLHWLEEKVHEKSSAEPDMNEIDRLADMFIASCHEKFRLEKQESYRRYQEMMARSM